MARARPTPTSGYDLDVDFNKGEGPQLTSLAIRAKTSAASQQGARRTYSRKAKTVGQAKKKKASYAEAKDADTVKATEGMFEGSDTEDDEDDQNHKVSKANDGYMAGECGSGDYGRERLSRKVKKVGKAKVARPKAAKPMASKVYNTRAKVANRKKSLREGAYQEIQTSDDETYRPEKQEESTPENEDGIEMVEEYIAVSPNDKRLPINKEKERLKHLGYHGQIFTKTPLEGTLPIILPRLNLVILKPSFPAHLNITDLDILNWLKSNQVLRLLKKWKSKLEEQYELTVDAFLPDESSTVWNKDEAIIANWAEHFALGNIKLSEDDESAERLSAFFAGRLANGSEHFPPLSQLPQGSPRFLACARVVLAAFADLMKYGDGFFAVLLESELVNPMRPQLRELWEAVYVVGEGKVVGEVEEGAGEPMELD
ncbi:hypothetical protein MBLNU230_g1823t1 [Neophaeotheca triangularis]